MSYGEQHIQTLTGMSHTRATRYRNVACRNTCTTPYRNVTKRITHPTAHRSVMYRMTYKMSVESAMQMSHKATYREPHIRSDRSGMAVGIQRLESVLGGVWDGGGCHVGAHVARDIQGVARDTRDVSHVTYLL
jgi:hypothetical protein